MAKRYFTDNGILNLFLFNGETKLLENLVALHLNHLYRNTKEELSLYYYNRGIEVDFCIPEQHLAIQVSYNLDDHDTYEREVGGLIRFLKVFNDYRGIIVTWDTEQQIENEDLRIDVIPCWKWLLC